MFSVTVCAEAMWFLLRRYCKWTKVNVAPIFQVQSQKGCSTSILRLWQCVCVCVCVCECEWILKCRKNNSETMKHIAADRSRTYFHCFHGNQQTISKSTSIKWFPQLKVGTMFFAGQNFLLNYQEERGSAGIIGEGFQKQVYNKLCIKLEYPDQFRKDYRTNASRRTFE
jgi:hypothetical protein